MTAITCNREEDTFHLNLVREAKKVLDVATSRRETHERTALNRRSVERGGRLAWVPVDLAEALRQMAIGALAQPLACYYAGEASAIVDVEAGDMPADHIDEVASHLMCEYMGYKKLPCPWTGKSSKGWAKEETCTES